MGRTKDKLIKVDLTDEDRSRLADEWERAWWQRRDRALAAFRALCQPQWFDNSPVDSSPGRA